jgi:hypothetical protein
LDLFNNPVGYCGLKSVASPAISRPGATLWGCEIAFFSGSCSKTEVFEQLYYKILNEEIKSTMGGFNSVKCRGCCKTEVLQQPLYIVERQF